MTNKFSCSSRSFDEQHDPNHASHHLAKTTTFEGSFSTTSHFTVGINHFFPLHGICLVLIFLVSVCPHKCWRGFWFITVRLHEVFNLGIKEMNIVGNETLTNMKYSEAKFVAILLMFFVLPH